MSKDNKSTYWCHVTFWAQHDGVIPVEAENVDEAQNYILERLTNVRDLTFLEINTEAPTFVDTDEEDTPVIH